MATIQVIGQDAKSGKRQMTRSEHENDLVGNSWWGFKTHSLFCHMSLCVFDCLNN